MKVYLCGQKYFGMLVLKMILNAGHNIVGVSAPSPESGAVDRLWGEASLKGIPVMPSGRLNGENLPPGVDLIVAAHSHDFIGRKTRNRSALGAIGFHPSLLPLHRGRDAIRWTIKLGEKISGGTVFWLNDTVDGGPVAAQDWCWVEPGDTAESLWREKIQPMGVRLLASALSDISAGRLVRIPQNHKMATWEPSLNPPPLYRPDLPQIGSYPSGYTVVMERDLMPIGM